jgi:hypothetical protein
MFGTIAVSPHLNVRLGRHICSRVNDGSVFGAQSAWVELKQFDVQQGLGDSNLEEQHGTSSQ